MKDWLFAQKPSCFGLKNIFFCRSKHDWKTSWHLVKNIQFCQLKLKVNRGVKMVSSCSLLVLLSCHPAVLMRNSARNLMGTMSFWPIKKVDTTWRNCFAGSTKLMFHFGPDYVLFLLCIKSCSYRFRRLAAQLRQSRRAPFCSSTDRCGAESAPGYKRLSKSPLLLPVIICCSFSESAITRCNRST